MAISYKDSGVDVERGYEAVRLMKQYVQSTYNDGVLGDIGSFGGFYQPPKSVKNPVLVAGTDGVGTKLKYAFVANKHDTIGIDAVAMCVNDVLACGALRLNLSDGTVEQGGQRTTLTRNELKILQVLLENRGKIVSRDRLMERLWESDSFVDENTLTVNVNRLRKTLAAVGAGDLIVTRKKQGYLVP